MQEMVQPPEQLPIVLPQTFEEEITSPLNAHILDFCESELFPETLQNSEVASNSNCCYEEHSSSYPTNLSLTSDMNKYSSSLENNNKFDPNNPTNTTTTTTPTITCSSNISSTVTPNHGTNNSNLSLLFDSPEEIENDISASIDFSTSPNFTVPQFLNTEHDQFDLSTLSNQIQVAPDQVVDHGGSVHQYNPDPPGVPLMAATLPPVYEDECLSSVPASYMRLTSSAPSCPLLDPGLGSYLPTALSVDNAGILSGAGLFLGSELAPQDLDFQGDNGGIFCTDTMPRVFNCTSDLQALTNESQHLIKGCTSSTPLASDITNLEDSSFKVGKLSVEERKEKIHRYMKKRNERNFSKKIKYACRKTLADSRPRVRGRFAKNDELAETARAAIMHHEEDTDEDCQHVVVVKEEEDMVDSSDIFAHLSGVNSFKCNNPINPLQSWI